MLHRWETCGTETSIKTDCGGEVYRENSRMRTCSIVVPTKGSYSSHTTDTILRNLRTLNFFTFHFLTILAMNHDHDEQWQIFLWQTNVLFHFPSRTVIQWYFHTLKLSNICFVPFFPFAGSLHFIPLRFTLLQKVFFMNGKCSYFYAK